MALRPLVFGVRLRDRDRTVRVRQQAADTRRYVVEVSRPRRDTRRRDHPSLAEALRDAARSWRERLQ